MKLSYFNCEPDIFKDPVLGRPFSNNIENIILTNNHDESDYIFCYLDYLNCNEDFEKIKITNLYKKYEKKFVFYSMHDNPIFAYKNKSINILCQPLNNDISNIIVSPLQMRHFEWEIINDISFIERCRKINKTIDLTFIGQTNYANRLKIINTNYGDLKTNFKSKGSIYSVTNKNERIKILKDFYTEISHSKFNFAPRGVGSMSFRFYQSLMVGTIPILSGHYQLPFEDKIDYDEICIFQNHEDVDFKEKLLNKINKINYEKMRTKGIEVWDEFFRMEKTDKHIFNYLNEKNSF